MPLMTSGTGMVRIHDRTIRRAVTHFTDFMPSVRPTPMTPPVMVCVVLTGMPRNEVTIKVVARPPIPALVVAAIMEAVVAPAPVETQIKKPHPLPLSNH